MNKKLIVFTAAALVALSLCGCAKPSGTKSVSLVDKGLEMAAAMDELASSPAYAASMSASDELGEKMTAMASGDYSAPKAVYSITVPDGKALELMFGGEPSGLSDKLEKWVDRKASVAISSQLMARSGAAALAAASCVAYSECFVYGELDAPVLYLYQYSGDYCVCVSFLPGQDGAVSASAMFVENDDTLSAAASADEVRAWLEGIIGIGELTVTDVSAK